MDLRRGGLRLLVAAAMLSSAARAQSADVVVDQAQTLVGRALFLRGSYIADDLSYDAAGKVAGPTKSGDWTLAAMDVKKVFRHGTREVELDGVRVAIRYNTDNHQFERHPQNDTRMRLLVADTGNARAFEAATDAIFAQGIDPRLQHAAPLYWQHYFNSGLAWEKDALTGQEVYAFDGPTPAKDVVAPVPLHKLDAEATSLALKDKVHGAVVLRLVVDATGAPQRIAIVRPLGYGLDERAVQAVAKWRFTPAERLGKPVAAFLQVTYDF